MSRKLKRFLWSRCAKLLFSVLVVVFVVYSVKSAYADQTCVCAVKMFDDCVDYYDYSLIKFMDNCHCSCLAKEAVVAQYVYLVLIPFILSYVFYSGILFVLEKRKKRKRKK